MIYINEMRQSLGAVTPEEVSELLDRLESAESDGLEQARLNGMGGEREAALLSKLEAAEKERDALRAELNEIRYGVAVAHDTIKALRAKIEEMEKQVPICRAEDLKHAESLLPMLGLKPENHLYALPVAQPAPSVPDEEAAYSEWFRSEQGVAYDGMWAFAKAAWMARAALNAAPKPKPKPKPKPGGE